MNFWSTILVFGLYKIRQEITINQRDSTLKETDVERIKETLQELVRMTTANMGRKGLGHIT